MKKRTVLSVIGLVVLISSASFAGPLDLDLQRHDPVNAMLRSAVIPGWGQFFNDQSFKGEIIGTVFFVSVGAYFYYTGAANTDYQNYQNQGLRNGSGYTDYENHKDLAIDAVYVGVGAWVVGVVDAYIFGKQRQDTGDQQQSLLPSEVQLTMRDSGVSLQWKRSF
ncbi:MAG: DUF5683 domain-containing protein [Endomicrobiales bacterium]|jgi:hypothetical protein